MGTKSDRYVNLIDEIDELYKGEYQEIKVELKDIFIQIGKDLGWKLKESNNEKILFKTPFSFRSIGETVTVNYYNNKITIESVSNQRSVMTTWGKNDDNCKKYLNNIVPEVKKYLKKKESSKQTENLEDKLKKVEEKMMFEKLLKDKKTIISQFDKDGNGELDTVEVKDDYDKLVKKHQSKIIEIDRGFIQQFVKISNYQKQKRKNLQSIFKSINKTKDQKELSSQVELLKEQIHSYELLLFHSLNMVSSLVEDDMFTFYEIYEAFDKLEIFNSNHENEVSKKLRNIEGGIYSLMTSIRQMEQNIIGQLGYLSYITQDSFNQLSKNVTRELNSIDSSIKINNLLTGINAYQTYKLRKGN